MASKRTKHNRRVLAGNRKKHNSNYKTLRSSSVELDILPSGSEAERKMKYVSRKYTPRDESKRLLSENVPRRSLRKVTEHREFGKTVYTFK